MRESICGRMARVDLPLWLVNKEHRHALAWANTLCGLQMYCMHK